MSAPRPLPPKKAVALELLKGPSLFVHLDPRRDNVVVPPWFKRQPQLVLQLGLNMAVAIRDLDVTDEGISGTLSFNRSPFWCFAPWTAVYALVGEDGRGMVYPDDVPPELAAAAQRAPAPAPDPAPAAEEPAPPKKRARSRRKQAEPVEGAPAPAPRPRARKRASAPVAQAAAPGEPGRELTPPTSLADAREARRLTRQPRRRATDWAPEQAATPRPRPARKGRALQPAPPIAPTTSADDQSTPADAEGKAERRLPPYLRVIK
jgi:hypothetical protein